MVHPWWVGEGPCRRRSQDHLYLLPLLLLALSTPSGTHSWTPTLSCTPHPLLYPHTLSCSSSHPSSHSPHSVPCLLPGSALRPLPCSFFLAPVTPPKTSYHFLLPFLGLQVHPFRFLPSDPQDLHTTAMMVPLAGESRGPSLVHRVP